MICYKYLLLAQDIASNKIIFKSSDYNLGKLIYKFNKN